MSHIFTLASLRRLRWLTLGALALIPLLTGFGTVDGSVAPLVGILAVALIGQAALTWWHAGSAGRRAAAVVLAADGVCLTAAFAFTDGSATPYAFLYLFPVVLGGLAVPGWPAIGVGIVCTVGYASLFVLSPANLHHHDHQAMLTHMYGMFVAYALTAALIVAAMGRMGRAQRAATDAMMAAQDLQARTERVASLATLAAGASHELANPLSTILMVASELHRKAQDQAAREDLQLIRDEVDRCRDVLTVLSTQTAAGAGHPGERTTLKRLLSDAWPDGHAIELRADDASLTVPVPLIHQVLRRLTENAAQADASHTQVHGRVDDTTLTLVVTDDGRGMDPTTLSRASEPFFTTRPHGTGLGLFFVHQVVEQLGGAVHVQSAPGEGTTVTLTLPLSDGAAS